MPTILGINYLHLCFTRIKIPLTQQQSQLTTSVDDQNRSLPPETILVKNFNSLYDDDRTTFQTTIAAAATTTASNSDSDTEATTPVTPDFATIYASQRFFFSSPGRSNSIIDSSPSSSSSSSSRAVPVLESESESDPLLRTTDSIAVSKYSPDPYVDFRRSMQEMVEARGFTDVQSNWDNLHELLLCYLALNPKSMQKFIVAAFSDLLATLMPSPEIGGRRKTDVSGGSCSIKQKLL